MSWQPSQIPSSPFAQLGAGASAFGNQFAQWAPTITNLINYRMQQQRQHEQDVIQAYQYTMAHWGPYLSQKQLDAITEPLPEWYKRTLPKRDQTAPGTTPPGQQPTPTPAPEQQPPTPPPQGMPGQAPPDIGARGGGPAQPTPAPPSPAPSPSGPGAPPAPTPPTAPPGPTAPAAPSPGAFTSTRVQPPPPTAPAPEVPPPTAPSAQVSPGSAPEAAPPSAPDEGGIYMPLPIPAGEEKLGSVYTNPADRSAIVNATPLGANILNMRVSELKDLGVFPVVNRAINTRRVKAQYGNTIADYMGGQLTDMERSDKLIGGIDLGDPMFYDADGNFSQGKLSAYVASEREAILTGQVRSEELAKLRFENKQSKVNQAASSFNAKYAMWVLNPKAVNINTLKSQVDALTPQGGPAWAAVVINGREIANKARAGEMVQVKLADGEISWVTPAEKNTVLVQQAELRNSTRRLNADLGLINLQSQEAVARINQLSHQATNAQIDRLAELQAILNDPKVQPGDPTWLSVGKEMKSIYDQIDKSGKMGNTFLPRKVPVTPTGGTHIPGFGTSAPPSAAAANSAASIILGKDPNNPYYFMPKGEASGLSVVDRVWVATQAAQNGVHVIYSDFAPVIPPDKVPAKPGIKVPRVDVGGGKIPGAFGQTRGPLGPINIPRIGVGGGTYKGAMTPPPDSIKGMPPALQQIVTRLWQTGHVGVQDPTTGQWSDQDVWDKALRDDRAKRIVYEWLIKQKLLPSPGGAASVSPLAGVDPLSGIPEPGNVPESTGNP